MIRDLKPYRFSCDWESDGAACTASHDLMATDPLEGIDQLVLHRGWRHLAGRSANEPGWLFCSDCKDSSMVDHLTKSAGRV